MIGLLLLAAPAIGAHRPPLIDAQKAATASVAPSPSGPGLDQELAWDSSQAAIGRQPSDYTLTDRHGETVRLSDYRGKPLLLNFVYTGCFKICPTSSRALHKSVLGMRKRFGSTQFNVVTIGFNLPSDSPTAMREFAARQRIDDPNWNFLSPRAADVPALAEDYGFAYVATPMGFDHTLQVSIIDATGELMQQVYGDTFAADALGEPLKKLLGGGLIEHSSGFADIFDKLRILCSVYDPLTGEYRTDYSLYLEIAGGLTFALTMLLLAIQEWRGRRALRRAATP